MRPTICVIHVSKQKPDISCLSANCVSALTLQVDDHCILALPQWVPENISYVGSNFISPFFPQMSIYVSSILFSLCSISEEHFAERLQL